MNLANLLKIELGQQEVILVGAPEITQIMDSDEQPYYVAKLKVPVTVRCSTDPAIDSFEADEVYIRESDLKKEGWVALDEKKPEDGFHQPGWVVDFSKGQGIAIYQSESIRKWSKGNRNVRRDSQRTELNAKIKAMVEARKS